MDAQAIYMYQNTPNDQGPGGPQRPGNGGNGSNGGGPRDTGTSILIRSILIMVVVLVGWYLFQYFTQANNSSTSGPNVIEVPYSTFYQQVQQGNVDTAVFQGQDVTGNFKNAITISDANGNTKTGTQYHFLQMPNGDPTLTALQKVILGAGFGIPIGIGDGNGIFKIAGYILPLENCGIDVSLLHLLIKCAIWHFNHIGAAGTAVVGLREVLEEIPSNQHDDHDED